VGAPVFAVFLHAEVCIGGDATVSLAKDGREKNDSSVRFLPWPRQKNTKAAGVGMHGRKLTSYLPIWHICLVICTLPTNSYCSYHSIFGIGPLANHP